MHIQKKLLFLLSFGILATSCGTNDKHSSSRPLDFFSPSKFFPKNFIQQTITSGKKKMTSYVGVQQSPEFGFDDKNLTYRTNNSLSFQTKIIFQNSLISKYLITHSQIPIYQSEIIRNGNWINAKLPTSHEDKHHQLHVIGAWSYNSEDQALQHLLLLLKGDDLQLIKKEKPVKKVYYPTDSGLLPAWSIEVQKITLNENSVLTYPTHFLLNADDGQILEKNDLVFHHDQNETKGIVKLLEPASYNEVLADIPTIHHLMLPAKHLSGRYFEVKNCKQNARSLKLCHHYLESYWKDGFPHFESSFHSENYDEAIAYHSINRMFQWHLAKARESEVYPEAKRKSLGLSEDNKIIALVRVLSLYEPDGKNPNDSASFYPHGFEDHFGPYIQIGTGWDINYSPENSSGRNHYLGKHQDVFYHEFNHFFIFQFIKEMKKQSGALHEGYADYFAYLLKNNPNLGIGLMERPDTPLRSAKMGGVLRNYIDDETDIHTLGRFWSTVLWRTRYYLNERNQVEYKYFDNAVWNSLNYLTESAGYYEAIVAIMQAVQNDKNINYETKKIIIKGLKEEFQIAGYLKENEKDSDDLLPTPSDEIVKSSDNTSSGSSETFNYNVEKNHGCSENMSNKRDTGTLALNLFLIIAVQFLCIKLYLSFRNRFNLPKKTS